MNRSQWNASNRNQRCGACRWWMEEDDNPEHGRCRRHPPAVVVMQQEQVTGKLSNNGLMQPARRTVNQITPVYPPTHAKDPGCGEFEEPQP